ncbi:MAG: hypothetical protein WBV94_32970 [Blastocatellia bacterium]
MPLIPDNDQQKIREHFAQNLAGAVEIVMFTARALPEPQYLAQVRAAERVM